MITIRDITRADFDLVLRLLAELGRPAPTPETRPDLETVFRHHVDSDDTYSQIAFDGERAVGFIAIHIRDRLNFVSREAWVPDFIVAEQGRGKRVGHMLFEKAIAIGERFNCHRLVLESGNHRAVAHEFYEQHKMEQTARVYALPLQPTDTLTHPD